MMAVNRSTTNVCGVGWSLCINHVAVGSECAVGSCMGSMGMYRTAWATYTMLCVERLVLAMHLHCSHALFLNQST